jgi:hypothetical protein
MRPVIAEFQSECPACETEILEGQLIVSDIDGWQHEKCPTDPISNPARICQKCWQSIANNGTCGCDQ